MFINIFCKYFYKIAPTGAVAYQIPCPAQMTKPPCRCRQCIAYYKPQVRTFEI